MRISSKNDNYQSVCMEASEPRFRKDGIAPPDLTLSIHSAVCRQLIWFETTDSTAAELRQLADDVEKHRIAYAKELEIRTRIASEMEGK